MFFSSHAATDNVKESPKTQSQQQQAPASNHITGSDSTKEQISKLRGANLKESSAPMFREAYYSQMREAHQANMCAVEAMEESKGDPGERRRRQSLNPDTVNNLMEDVIREIAAEGELVTKEKVTRMCDVHPVVSPVAVDFSIAVTL